MANEFEKYTYVPFLQSNRGDGFALFDKRHKSILYPVVAANTTENPQKRFTATLAECFDEYLSREGYVFTYNVVGDLEIKNNIELNVVIKKDIEMSPYFTEVLFIDGTISDIMTSIEAAKHYLIAMFYDGEEDTNGFIQLKGKTFDLRTKRRTNE